MIEHDYISATMDIEEKGNYEENCVHCEHEWLATTWQDGVCDKCDAKGYKPRSYYDSARHYKYSAVTAAALVFFMTLLVYGLSQELPILIGGLVLTGLFGIIFAYFDNKHPHVEETEWYKKIQEKENTATC